MVFIVKSNTIIAVYGDVGSGKSTILTAFAEFSYQNGFTTIANYHEKHSKLFSLSDFIHNRYSNSLVNIDEAYLYIDSRKSSNNMNLLISHAAFQSRKKNNVYIFAVQELRVLDIRVRDLIHIFVYCEAKFDDSGFTFTFFTRKRILGTKFLSKQNAQFIFQFFDSFEILQNEEMDYGSIETKDERIHRIEQLAIEIPLLAKKEKKRISKSYIQHYLFQHKMNRKDYIDIFNEIKNGKDSKMIIEGKEEKEQKEKDDSYFG